MSDLSGTAAIAGSATTTPTASDPVATATVKSSSRDNHKVLMWVVPEKKKK